MINLQTRPVLKGALLALSAFFCLAIMQSMAKLLTGLHGPVELAFYRNLVSITPLLGYLLLTRKFALLMTDRPWLLSARVLVGTLGLIVFFSVTQIMPLAEATVFFFASTLIIPVLSFFFLKEQSSLQRWVAILIGFCGVLIAAKPGGDVALFGVLLGLSGAFIHAVIMILLRAMRSVPTFTVTFYFFLGGILIPGMFMPFIGHVPNAQDAVILLAIGVFGGLSQYFLTSAFKYAPASVLAPMNYSGLVWASGLDILIWHNMPGWNVFAGAALIMGAQMYIIARENAAARAAAKKLQEDENASPVL